MLDNDASLYGLLAFVALVSYIFAVSKGQGWEQANSEKLGFKWGYFTISSAFLGNVLLLLALLILGGKELNGLIIIFCIALIGISAFTALEAVKRRKWALVVSTFLSFNILWYIINIFYLRNRWDEFDSEQLKPRIVVGMHDQNRGDELLARSTVSLQTASKTVPAPEKLVQSNKIEIQAKEDKNTGEAKILNNCSEVNSTVNEYPRAILAIKYRNDLEKDWDKVRKLGKKYSELYLANLDDKPDQEAAEILEYVLTSYKLDRNPFDDEELNRHYAKLHQYGEVAQKKFREIHDVLGAKFDPEIVSKSIKDEFEPKIISNYELMLKFPPGLYRAFSGLRFCIYSEGAVVVLNGKSNWNYFNNISELWSVYGSVLDSGPSVLVQKNPS